MSATNLARRLSSELLHHHEAATTIVRSMSTVSALPTACASSSFPLAQKQSVINALPASSTSTMFPKVSSLDSVSANPANTLIPIIASDTSIIPTTKMQNPISLGNMSRAASAIIQSDIEFGKKIGLNFRDLPACQILGSDLLEVAPTIVEKSLHAADTIGGIVAQGLVAAGVVTVAYAEAKDNKENEDPSSNETSNDSGATATKARDDDGYQTPPQSVVVPPKRFPSISDEEGLGLENDLDDVFTDWTADTKKVGSLGDGAADVEWFIM